MLKEAFFKKLFILLLTTSLFTSCAKTYIFETKQVTNSIIRDNKKFFVFENDTMRIVYSFWSKGGSMAFSIYNKLDIPIYVNWKRSSLVLNSQKTDYWAEESISKMKKVSRTSGVEAFDFSSPLYYLLSLSSSTSVTYVQQTTVVPERITFIAPRSYVFKDKNGLMAYEGLLGRFKWTHGVIDSPDGLKKKVKAEVTQFNQASTPIIFRNFLSLSTSENFDREIYIDHSFYVSKIIRVNSSETFENQYSKKLGKVVPKHFFYNPTSFYINDK